MAFPALLGIGGSLLGSLLPKLFEGNNNVNSAFTRPEKVREFERLDPNQQQLMNYLQNILTGEGKKPSGGILGQLFSPEGFEAYARPARQEFFESTVPKLAERFSGLGAGAQRSSAFQQQLAQAGSDLSQRLADMRSQQQQNLLGPLLGTTLQPTKDRIYEPAAPTGLAKGLSSFGGQTVGAAIPLLFNLLNKKLGM